MATLQTNKWAARLSLHICKVMADLLMCAGFFFTRRDPGSDRGILRISDHLRAQSRRLLSAAAEIDSRTLAAKK
jgi:hypothetical protein